LAARQAHGRASAVRRGVHRAVGAMGSAPHADAVNRGKLVAYALAFGLPADYGGTKTSRVGFVVSGDPWAGEGTAGVQGEEGDGFKSSFCEISKGRSTTLGLRVTINNASIS